MTNELLNVKVAKKTIVAKDVASYELVAADGSELPEFTAGSHVDVHLGDNLLRQYSLHNSPNEKQHYCLGVLRTPDSKGGSIAMHDQVNEGDNIQISQPRNSFHLIEDAKFSLLLAGGIGVTPIMCMAQRLHEIGADFEMHYCTRSLDRMAFHDFFANSPFADRVTFHFDDGAKEQLLDIPGKVKDYSEGYNLYVCGPTGFMDAVIQNAEKAWPVDKVHREYFSADPKAGHDDDGSFTVKIASTGKEYVIPTDQTIIEVLREDDIEIPVSCEQGICGTCMTNVLEGTPDHRDLYMTDAEKEANNKMTPCCSRALSDSIVLDL